MLSISEKINYIEKEIRYLRSEMLSDKTNQYAYAQVEEVFNRIKDFPYAIITSNGKILKDSRDYSDMVNISPDEFINKYRCGTCVDTTEYLFRELKHLNPHKLYFETEEAESHVIMYVKDNDKYIVPEASFKKHLGIHTFRTFKQMLKYVERIHCDYFNRKGCSIIDYTNVKTRYHLGYRELWHLVWSSGKILKIVKRNYLDL